MKGIECCGDCGYYNWPEHRCSRGCTDRGAPNSRFYDDCPLPDVEPVVTADRVFVYKNDGNGGVIKTVVK